MRKRTVEELVAAIQCHSSLIHVNCVTCSSHSSTAGLVAPHQLQILPRAWREFGFQHGSVPRSSSYFSGYDAAILLQITHIEQFLKLSRSHAASEMSFLPKFFFLHRFPRCATISASASKRCRLSSGQKRSEKCLLQLWHQILSIFGHICAGRPR